MTRTIQGHLLYTLIYFELFFVQTDGPSCIPPVKFNVTVSGMLFSAGRDHAAMECNDDRIFLSWILDLGYSSLDAVLR